VMASMPSWQGAAHVRNLSAGGLGLLYRMRASGAHHIGSTGPLVIVCSSEAVIAGAVIQAIAPRPVHVVPNAAMSAALPAALLQASGAIVPASTAAIEAQESALEALTDGRAVAVVGSLVDPSWLVATSKAPVLCVTLVGERGRVPTDPPRLRSLIRAYVSEQVTIASSGDPLRVSTRAAVTERLRQLIADADDQALRRAGLWEAS
jgi:hypothetical protein